MWLKIVATTVVILGITACGSSKNSEKIEILKVNKIFLEEIPKIYQSCHNQEVNEMFGLHTVYLLFPKLVESNKPLYVEIYGCWITGHHASYISLFDGLDIDKIDSNKIQLTLKRIDNAGGDVPTVEEEFQQWYSYDINGSWESGELEVIVQNPNDEVLRTAIVVE